MFEQLFNESPMIQKIREQERQESIQNLQLLIVGAVQRKYPVLAEFARQQVSRLSKPETLNKIILRLMDGPDANTIRGMLKSMTEI